MRVKSNFCCRQASPGLSSCTQRWVLAVGRVESSIVEVRAQRTPCRRALGCTNQRSARCFPAGPVPSRQGRARSSSSAVSRMYTE